MSLGCHGKLGQHRQEPVDGLPISDRRSGSQFCIEVLVGQFGKGKSIRAMEVDLQALHYKPVARGSIGIER